MENNKSHLTAITRKSPSAPCRWMHKQGLLVGSMLDYGCGKGFDAHHYGMYKYDPGYFPVYPWYWFDTVTCTYVLNVLDEIDANIVIADIKALLTPDGNAYFTVRRDVKKDGFTSKGTFQRNVNLDFQVLRETSSFCIYHMPG